MFESEDLFSAFETKPKRRYANEPATPEVEWNDFEAGSEVMTFGSDRKVCQYQFIISPDATEKASPFDGTDISDPARTYPFELDPFQKVRKPAVLL